MSSVTVQAFEEKSVKELLCGIFWVMNINHDCCSSCLMKLWRGFEVCGIRLKTNMSIIKSKTSTKNHELQKDSTAYEKSLH